MGVGAPASPEKSSNRSYPDGLSASGGTGTGRTGTPTSRHRAAGRPSGGVAASRRRPASQGHSHQQQQTRLIQCPLCARNFPKSVIEIHAASCEGRPAAAAGAGADDDNDTGPTMMIDDGQISGGLSVHLPPEKAAAAADPLRHLHRQQQQQQHRHPAPRSASQPGHGGVASKRRPTGRTVECPICNQKYPQSSIEEHAASCGDEVYV